MVFDLLVVASVVGALWWWHERPRQARHAREGDQVSLLGYDDLPPIGAFDPLPQESDLDHYVESGLEQLDTFLHGHRGQTA